MAEQPGQEYILGVDLGSNSVGWAVIVTENGEPRHLVRAGARVFEAGMEGDLASGREESRNLKRRQMRSQRRQTWRRGRRLKKIFGLLQRYELLPADQISSPVERQELLNRLDREILASAWFAAKVGSGLYPEAVQTMPYILRAAALDEPLAPFFLGRALYHLAQRRGFWSNRKQVAKKGDDEGKVKEGIAELRKAMQAKSARTLGEYFSRLAPSEERIRCRWTARDMYEAEFDAIRAAQAKHNPQLLTQDREKELRRAIFYQRPLWFDRDTIGQCELEREERRAPAHLLLSQRFRLLDKVNNLQINGASLTPADREKLVQELELHGDLTFKKMRKLLGLTRDDEINLERGGEERVPGNRTFAEFYEALGQGWLDMTAEERDQRVEYVYAFEKPDKLAEAVKRKWNLDEDSARKLAGISLEPDYLNHSARAMRKLLPLLEQGVPYPTARKQLYPESFRASDPVDLLPPVVEFDEIRNPGVMRSLTELRKVVNAIIREHGKPAEIRIELARELKKPKKAREAASKKNRENERARIDAAKRVTAEAGIRNPSRRDIRKVLLAEECGWHCPYTGRQISMRTLFSEPQFDIEHIIPFSRSLDDSFPNVTLCANEENRNRKGNKTPYEAYVGEPERYQEILSRLAHFAGDRGMAAEKLRRFRMTPEEVEVLLSDFTARQLADTAYSSRLAAQYLGLLYGGVVDAESRRRVQATSGQVTAYLRNEWKLNGILGDGTTSNGGKKAKSRDDHRHHAVDAVAIGLTDAGTVKMLSDAAQRAPLEHRRRFGSVPAPWPDFVDSVREKVEKIVVSHRVSKKVSGALHEETNYAGPLGPNGERRIRKALSQLSVTELEDIADPSVKKLVLAQLEKLGGGDPKKLFADEKNLPCFETRDRRRFPIKRVRINKAVPTFQLGEGRTARHVATDSNHHLEVFAELDADGNEVEWDGEVVSMAEGCRRMKGGLPVVQREFGPHRTFRFSLAAGEMIECDAESGGRRLLVCRGVSQYSAGQVVVSFLPVNNAQRNPKLIRVVPNKMGQLHARKMAVSPLGEVSEAHD